MSTQIAVRLPEELVNYLDQTVASGQATSRAAIITSALEREMRRMLAEHDAAILRAQTTPDDLDGVVTWTAAHPTMVD